MQIIAQTSPEYSQEKLGHQGDSLERPRDTWLIHIFWEGCMCLKLFHVEDTAYSKNWKIWMFMKKIRHPLSFTLHTCIPTCNNSLPSESNLGDVITDHFHCDKNWPNSRLYNSSLIKYSQRLNYDVACPMDFKK